MALLSMADGNSIMTEKIYPDRFLHVAELARLGASLHKEGSTVVVQGVKRLIGAPVMASDLRASAAPRAGGTGGQGHHDGHAGLPHRPGVRTHRAAAKWAGGEHSTDRSGRVGSLIVKSSSRHSDFGIQFPSSE